MMAVCGRWHVLKEVLQLGFVAFQVGLSNVYIDSVGGLCFRDLPLELKCGILCSKS